MKTLPVTADQEAELQAWRTLALQRMPYMASMLFALRPVNAPGLGTFAVDEHWRLYIDFEAVGRLGSRWCAEALLHECGHLFGEHSGLARDLGVQPDGHRLWNICTDASINDDLRDAGCDMADAVLPARIGQPDYQTAETYWKALQQRRSAQQPQGGSAGGSDANSQDGPGRSGKARPFDGCGSGSGGEAAPCELPGSDSMDGHAPAVTKPEQQATQIATAASIKDHAAKGRGTVPAGLVERAEMLLAPSKVPWRTVIRSTLRRSVARRSGQHDVTYTRRNRRRHTSDVIYPASYEPKANIVVVRDTSGSMSSEDLNAVGCEIEAISRKMGVRGNDLRVIDVDTKPHAIRPYTSIRLLEQVAGRGGTDMRAGIEAAMAAKPQPSVIVVATDGLTPWPEVTLPVPVVACIIGPESAAEGTPDWMPTVAVEPVAG